MLEVRVNGEVLSSFSGIAYELESRYCRTMGFLINLQRV